MVGLIQLFSPHSIVETGETSGLAGVSHLTFPQLPLSNYRKITREICHPLILLLHNIYIPLLPLIIRIIVVSFRTVAAAVRHRVPPTLPQP